MANRSDDQRKAMFANMSNPSSKRKSKGLKRPKRGSIPSSARKLPRRLPIVTVKGVKYFRDDRLKEFRAVDDPHKRISFKSISDAGDWMDSIHPKNGKRIHILSEEIKAKQREVVERKTKSKSSSTLKINKRYIPQFETTKEKWMVAKAINDTNNEIDRKAKTNILKKHNFKVSDEWKRREKKIVNPDSDYLMNDKDFLKYRELTHAERSRLGLKIPDKDLTSDYQSRPKLEKAENDFINASLKIIPSELAKDLESAKRDYRHRQKLIEISSKLDTKTIR